MNEELGRHRGREGKTECSLCGNECENGKFGQNGKFSQNGKFGQNGMSGQKGKVHLGPNVSSSAHHHGCVVNGSGAMAAI